MRAKTEEQQLERLLRQDPSGARAYLYQTPPQPLLRTVRRLSRADRARAFRLLNEAEALPLFVGLDASEQTDLITDKYSKHYERRRDVPSMVPALALSGQVRSGQVLSGQVA